jgi:putative oxidoreductase
LQSMEKLRPLTLLLLRVGLGVIFIYNGYPKLFTHTRQSMVEMRSSGLPAYFTYIAGALEVGGGAMLVVGLFTRFVGLLFAGEMAVAIWKAEHFLAHPLAVDKYELALACMAGAFALATFGAGPVSMDAAMFRGEGRSPSRAKRKDKD